MPFRITDKLEYSLAYLTAMMLSLFTIYTAIFGVLTPSLQRTIHFFLSICLGLLLSKNKQKKENDRYWQIINVFLYFFAMITLSYFIIYDDRILSDWVIFISEFEKMDWIVSVLTTIFVLAVGYRLTGSALPIIAVSFMLYARFGSVFPDFMRHAGFSWQRIMEILYFGFDGVFGIPLGISATVISIFIVFGCFFEACGGGDALMDLGKYIAGRSRGGPAKIAVVGSSFMGTISGSAVANVYATGTFTIPMMKKVGYKPEVAGAIEACASTGGQILPPVMGAAAFIMADYTGLPYGRIALAAIIPGVLYYLSLFLSVDFEAAQTGIQGLNSAELPKRKVVLKQLPLLAPVLTIVVMLVLSYSAMLAGVYATGVSIVVSFLTPHNKMTWRRILDTLVLAGKRIVVIAISTAMSGIIIGVIAYTSIGMNFIALVMSLPPEFLWVAPMLVAIAAIILGMGVPTSVAYIIVAAVAIPALRKIGFGMLESHMFAFYFAVLSMITPPVAPASLAASEIAGSTFLRTGKEACKFGFVTFIIPFYFLYRPELLFIGDIHTICITAIISLLAVVALVAGINGWFIIRMNRLDRILCCLAGGLLVYPSAMTDIIGIAGLTIFFVSVIVRHRQISGS